MVGAGFRKQIFHPALTQASGVVGKRVSLFAGERCLVPPMDMEFSGHRNEDSKKQGGMQARKKIYFYIFLREVFLGNDPAAEPAWWVSKNPGFMT